MYIPRSNAFTDREGIIDFIKRFSFGTIVSVVDNTPVATHLPFLVTERGDNVIVASHFALGNDQWKAIETGSTLIIFTEPHAYISPANYESEVNVPTWNYVSVHVYGKCKIIRDTKEVTAIIENTINNYDLSYRQQWENLPDEYKSRMLKGIVAFEMLVEDIQGKKKISQNKSRKEQETIMTNLSKSEHTNEKVVAEFMKKHLDTLT